MQASKSSARSFEIGDVIIAFMNRWTLARGTLCEGCGGSVIVGSTRNWKRLNGQWSDGEEEVVGWVRKTDPSPPGVRG